MLPFSLIPQLNSGLLDPASTQEESRYYITKHGAQYAAIWILSILPMLSVALLDLGLTHNVAICIVN